MKRFLLSLLYVSTFFIIGCKKDFPPEQIKDPTFYCKATINGAPINIGAGNEDYYMFSSYTQNSITGVYSFISTLKRVTGASNNNVFEISINDDTVSSSGAPIQINGSLLNNTYYALEGIPGNITHYSVGLLAEPDPNLTVQSYFWKFGDGTTLTTGPGTPAITHHYYHPGNYPITLTTTYTNGNSKDLINDIELGTKNAGMVANINDSVVGSQNIFWATCDGTPGSYVWGLVETTSTLSNPSHIYATQGVKKIDLTVSNSNNPNAITQISKYIKTANYTGPDFIANFRIVNYSTQSWINPNKYSLVTIRWTDNNGITYSSNGGLQSLNSTEFKIISVEDYKANEKGEPTKKLHVSFECLLYNGSASIPAKGEAIIAVSYK